MLSSFRRVVDLDGGSKILKSVCHSCHGGCSVFLHVEDGKLVRVEGDPDGPLNHGAVCPMGYAAPDVVNHPDRLKYPMKRIGPRGSGQWERITWDEALDTIVGVMKKAIAEGGPESIVFGSGTGRHLAKWLIRFANAVGTPNWCEPGTAQCFIPRINVGVLTYGWFPVGDFSRHTNPKCVVYWGHNPLNSGPDGETRFAARETLATGPKVVVVDPRENELTKHADVWLRLRPGTDDAVALAVVHTLIFEDLYDHDYVEKHCFGFAELKERVRGYSPEWAEPICWVPAEKIRQAARLIASVKPMQMEWGVALEHTPNCIQTVRAVALIPALTGNVDVPGGWVFGSDEIGQFPMFFENLSEGVQTRRLGSEGGFKLLTEGPVIKASHIPAVLKAIKTGDPYRVRAFLVFGNNALTTYGNSKAVYEALKEVEFMVQCDLFMQPTAELADIILPAAFWPELNTTHDAPFFSSYTLGALQKSTQIGECKSDEEIFVLLANRLGLELGREPVEETLDIHLRSGRTGLDYEALKTRTSILVPFEYGKRLRDGFPTPTGKIELYCTGLEKMGYDPLPYYEEPPESPYSQPELAREFPLVLTTGHRSKFFFHSEGRQIQRLRKAHKDPRAEIHPVEAAKHGIKDGDWMWIEGPRGRIKQKAKLTDAIDPRVICAEHGWWFPENKAPDHGVWESNINVLTNNGPPYDPAMGTYQLRGLLCRVEKVTELVCPE